MNAALCTIVTTMQRAVAKNVLDVFQRECRSDALACNLPVDVVGALTDQVAHALAAGQLRAYVVWRASTTCYVRTRVSELYGRSGLLASLADRILWRSTGS